MSIQEIIQEVRTLPLNEQKQLIKALVDIMGEPQAEAQPETLKKQRSLRELRGLGKEIWAGVDVQEYIDQQRNEWDSKA